MKDRDFINIDIMDSILEYITNDIKKQYNSHFLLNDELEYLIEMNKYERSSVILANYYNTDLKGKDLGSALLNIVYDTLQNPTFNLDDDDEFYIENSKAGIYSDENFYFNNPIYNWYEYSAGIIIIGR